MKNISKANGNSIAQFCGNVNTFSKIFFYYTALRQKVENFKAKLDTAHPSVVVYPRTIKGASTPEFIRTKREYDARIH